MGNFRGGTALSLALFFWLAFAVPAQVCRISTSGLNRNRSVAGPVHSECPNPLHSAPFGNWGVTSNFGLKQNGHQFQGWCHDTRICDNRGNCRTECRDGWYEWNSCTDIDEFRAPNCTLYNDKECTAQVSTTGENSHGTRTVDVPVRCPMDTNGDGVSDRGGCDDARVFSNGTNFMSLYELDPGTPDDLVQTIYFPATPVSLTCSAFGCTPVRSDWVTPNAYDSPTSPAKVSAQFALAVNSAVFVDTARSCRAIGPALETVTAASFRGQGVAPESIASVFGEGLAIATANAGTVPLPLELSGSSVAITDSVGASRAAPLFYVSPGQINFQVPPGTATGAARIVVSRSDTVTSRGSLQIIPVSPDLFAANANGEGVAAASALRLNANGIAEAVPVFQCGPAPLSCIPTPIELGARPTYLTLYGTGLRGAANRADVTAEIGGIAAEILYAGPQPRFIGLDQVNLVVPATLRGRGVVEIRLTIGARVSNPVTIAVR